MFTLEEVWSVFCFWGIFGFFYIAICQPNVQNKKRAILNTIASGPLCWVILGIFGLKYYIESKTINKKNRSLDIVEK